MRERLSELLDIIIQPGEKTLGDVADHLLANGVTIQKQGRCEWCEPGKEKCGTCLLFFDYYGDGGSDRCSGECDDKKCANYIPMNYCPNCGADMREPQVEE
jgi:hypothetical protein